MVKVKIKTTVITSQYGTLLTGDELTTNAEFAKHLVDDCNAAEYITKPELPTENLSTSETSTAPAKPAKHQLNQQSTNLLEKAKKLFNKG